MTVQELIDYLNKIEDKGMPVTIIYDSKESDLEFQGIVYKAQPQRLTILSNY